MDGMGERVGRKEKEMGEATQGRDIIGKFLSLLPHAHTH